MSFDKHISKYEPILFEDSRGYLKVISEDSNLGISYKESFSSQEFLEECIFRFHLMNKPNIYVFGGNYNRLCNYIR